MWTDLEALSANKGSKLKEASDEQQFLREVSDFDLWIDEVGKALASEDLGKVCDECSSSSLLLSWDELSKNSDIEPARVNCTKIFL